MVVVFLVGVPSQLHRRQLHHQYSSVAWSRSRHAGQIRICSSSGPVSESGRVFMAYRFSKSSVTCFTISTVLYFSEK